MTSTAIQFGAGNIGRGFLAQLFHESGLEVVFVDVAENVIAELNTRRGYTIEIVGPEAHPVPIDNVRALDGREITQVAQEIAQAAIVCTAVGANALPYTAPALAAGLVARHRGSGEPLNILLCENLHDATSVLRDAVTNHLPPAEARTILAKTGFVQAVVSRMVPLQTPPEDAPLTVRVEAYKRLPVDGTAIVGTLPSIVGIEPVPDFAAYVERKLYTHNCAHAILGYLGHAAGYLYGYEALQDSRIAALLQAILDETGQALIRKHGFAPEEHAAHVADLLQRFANKALGDTCLRLARDPIRKLAPDDRLIGAARCCESQGIAPKALAWGIAAALRFEDERDPISLTLQTKLRDLGRETVLRQICGVLPTEPLAALIEEALQTTQT